MASITQIAHELKISTATVSNALSGRGRVSKELRDRIIEFAREQSYRPNVNAKRLLNGRSAQILFGALVEPKNQQFDINHTYMIHYLTNELLAHDYDLIVHPFSTGQESLDKLLEKALDKTVDGMLLQLDMTMVPDLLERLGSMSFPTVVLDNSDDVEEYKGIEVITHSILPALLEIFPEFKLPRKLHSWLLHGSRGRNDGMVRDYMKALDMAGKKYSTDFGPADKSPEQYLTMAETMQTQPGVKLVFSRVNHYVDYLLWALKKYNLRVGRDVFIISAESHPLVPCPGPNAAAMLSEEFPAICHAMCQQILNQIGRVNDMKPMTVFDSQWRLVHYQ